MRILLILSFLMTTSCAKINKKAKDMQSNYMGGLDRQITVYTQDGTPLRQWKGKADLSFKDGRTLFDINGKRVTVQGGVVITEEL